MIVVVGAGPAGLSAAYHLDGHDYLVLEAASEPGGLCRSFELGGTIFDLGGHAFFTKHDYVRRLVTELCEQGLYAQPREAWIYSHDTFIRYPFQSHLHGLPGQVVEDCLVGLYEAAARHRDARPTNLGEWIAATFGPGIAKHFLVPYNEKVWAFPLSEVAPDWTGERVVTPDPRDIVAGALRQRRFSAFPNATVTYPAAGGFANLYRGFLRTVGDRIVRHTVREVFPAQRRLRTEDGTVFDYDHLISTMPLDELVACSVGLESCCREAAASLRHNSLHLVNLVFDRPAMTTMQRTYCADPAVPFHKLVFNSNSNDDLRGRPCFGVQAEVSWSAYKPVDPEGLPDRVLDALRRMGIATPDDRVIASSVITLDRAYPVQTPRTADARAHLLTDLGRYGISCAGRFGEWRYINSDDAVMRGKARAEELLASGAAERSAGTGPRTAGSAEPAASNGFVGGDGSDGHAGGGGSAETAGSVDIERRLVAEVVEPLLGAVPRTMDQELAELGADSMALVHMIAQAEEIFDVELPPAELIEDLSVAGLAGRIRAQLADRGAGR